MYLLISYIISLPCLLYCTRIKDKHYTFLHICCTMYNTKIYRNKLPLSVNYIELNIIDYPLSAGLSQ